MNFRNHRFFFRSLVAVALGSLTLAAHAAQYAYLVGICDYPTPLDAQGNPLKDEKGEVIDNDLRGCVNDVNAISALLTGKYNFPAANIRKSLDKDANGQNFVNNMKWLLESTKAGDDVVFFFSGHGAQVENPNAREDTPDDKIDETLVLADGTLVVDDLFNELRTIFVEKGVNITFVFDCCFSGGMGRYGLIDGRVPREKSLGINPRGQNYKPMTRALMNAARPQITGRDVLNRQMNSSASWAFIYASTEENPSVDLGPVGDNPAHGLFTLLLTAVLDKEPKLPANPLVEEILKFTTEKGFKQGPMAEFSSLARANAPVFPGAK